jgi:hypothetical protein
LDNGETKLHKRTIFPSLPPPPSRELLPVQQAGSYSRLLPRATPGATSRELLPTTPESYSRCNKPGATPGHGQLHRSSPAPQPRVKLILAWAEPRRTLLLDARRSIGYANTTTVRSNEALKHCGEPRATPVLLNRLHRKHPGLLHRELLPVYAAPGPLWLIEAGR